VGTGAAGATGGGCGHLQQIALIVRLGGDTRISPMEPETQLYLAEILRKRQRDLQSALDRINGEDATLGEPALRVMQDVAATMADVARHLQWDGERRKRSPAIRLYLRLPARIRRFLSRLRGLLRPRIGVLHHYPPRPLRVPASYLTTEPPTAAPTISLVTPAFAHGRFLERTICSVLAQHYPRLEYFVQDGGSTDETLDVLRAYDELLDGWASEPDAGQADAINRGFQRTTGEIMGWLNSDDLLLPGALAYVAQYFAAHPEIDIVYGDRLIIDESDGEIGAWILPRHDDNALMLADYVPQETLFWRRDIWKAAGGRVDPDFGYALDWDLLLRFQKAGANIVHLPRFLGAFRVYEAQKTLANHAVGIEECDRLRLRVHARPLPAEEVARRLRPYLRRQVLVHTRYRLVRRLRVRREDPRPIPYLISPTESAPDRKGEATTASATSL
jgi:glycosyltransferase involved in cell wall biosynthesis